MIPYAKQSITDADIEAVVQAMKSDFLTCGPLVEEFEKQFASYLGVKHAVACSSGTAALHLAMLAAEIGEGDRVVTSPITFLASANSARFVGAEIDFCDVEPTALTIDAEKLSDQWKPGTKAIVAVDYAGHPTNFEKIAKVARENGAVVIEDACHSVGGSVEIDGREVKVGNLPGVDMTTFSFHAIKTMTTGEGGMLVTNDDKYASRAKLLRSHGMVRNTDDFVAFGEAPLEESGPWSYEMQELGYNYRLTDFQSALGLSQLKRLDEFVDSRAATVAKYHERLKGVDCLQLPGVADWVPGNARIAWHLYALRIDFSKLKISRAELVGRLREAGIGTQVLYIPVCGQPYYRSDLNLADYKNSFEFYDQMIALPLFYGLTEEQVDNICGTLLELIR